MRLPRNNLEIIGIAFAIWLVSWLFVGAVPRVLWYTGKSLLPFLTISLMYILELKTVSTKGRNPIIVHCTYPVTIFLLAMFAAEEIRTSLQWEKTDTVFTADIPIVMMSVWFGFIFWVFRAIEIASQKQKLNSNWLIWRLDQLSQHSIFGKAVIIVGYGFGVNFLLMAIVITIVMGVFWSQGKAFNGAPLDAAGVLIGTLIVVIFWAWPIIILSISHLVRTSGSRLLCRILAVMLLIFFLLAPLSEC